MKFFSLHRRKIHPQMQSLNAYVVFKDEDGVTKALERSDTLDLEHKDGLYPTFDPTKIHKLIKVSFTPSVLTGMALR